MLDKLDEVKKSIGENLVHSMEAAGCVYADDCKFIEHMNGGQQTIKIVAVRTI